METRCLTEMFYGHHITKQRVNYSDFHKNRVRYNINTTNEDKY